MHIVKAYVVVEVYLQSFLVSARDGLSDLHPPAALPWEKEAHGTY